MKRFVLIIISFALLFIASAKAQNTPEKTAEEKIYNVSGCGQALSLPTPNYPVAARNMKLYGTVKVSIVIDKEGNVIEAEALSGHPILQTSAVATARRAKFRPTTLSGQPVKVRGIILYNFAGEEYNWLDIGIMSEIFRFSEMLPTGFGEEKNLFETYLKSDTEEKDTISETIRASVESKLSNDEKKLWLFQVGTLISEIIDPKYKFDQEKSNKNMEKLRAFVINPPKNVSPLLIEKLQTITKLPKQNTAEFWRQMNYILDNVSFLGR